jgi:DNA end-binding protein Ku
MPEAVWNGYLRLSSAVSCPVRLAPATKEPDTLKLEELNSRTGNPLTQQFVDSRTGDVVSADQIVKGHQEPGLSYVMIAGSELAALAGAAPSIIDVTHFCWRDQIDRARFETSYYIYPESGHAADTLDGLRLAMRRAGRDGIAYVHLGERECVAVIQPHGAGLMLSTLRPPRLLEPAEFVERADSEVPADMIDLAEAIIQHGILVGDANALPDRYENRLRTLIEQKSGRADGAPVSPAAAGDAPPPPPAFPVREAALAAAASPAMAESRPPPWVDEVRPDGERLFVSDSPSPAEQRGRELGAEILLLIMGLGDRRFVEPGWAGHPGSHRQIEAISIRPREKLEPSAIEFRVFGLEGRATAWVSNGNYAGTRGRQSPLTGFAVRPALELRDQYDIVYEGCFFEGGVVGPKRNGDICTSPVPNDPLEAVRISIFER